MSYMADISNYYSVGTYSGVPDGLPTANSSDDKLSLDMTDFLTLMITELTNQSIDETADTSDMLNQMVMMQMVQALVNMTEAQGMSYSTSLVGKEVTVADYDSNNNLQEVVGTVTGVGTIDGEQVLFIGEDYYSMSNLLAVGRLPETLTGADGTSVVKSSTVDTVEESVASETVDASAAASTADNGTAAETGESGTDAEAVEATASTDTAEDLA
jgi:flagellar basal-body rod modification protein FlgD